MFTDTSLRREEAGQNLQLTLLTTASTPVTPGPSTPTAIRNVPIDPPKDSAIVPPIRPASTPFPKQDLLEGEILCSHRINEPETEYADIFSSEPLESSFSRSTLCNLPTEIHECILDHLFGVRASASGRNSTSGKSQVLRSWNSALRHARRREVSELALVSQTWRDLIQDRLYRHLKIKATVDSLEQATMYFAEHPHLCPHVKHIEFWFPVFQQKNAASEGALRIPITTPDRSIGRPLAMLGLEPVNGIAYQIPSNNATLEEVFLFVKMTFGEACILTLEGGERKKPPMVRYFRPGSNFAVASRLPTLSTIKTLVCKGQWNLIRSNEDFQLIASALPTLKEWHGSYAKPKSKAYISMSTVLPRLPQTLTYLNICLEGDYRRESMCPPFFRKVTQQTHFCLEMGKAIPTLEHLVYTGRVCHSFFDQGARLSNSRTSRLKSVDLIVKNCCRPQVKWTDASGITDIAFIAAFEALVTSGIRALEKFSKLELLRIRFIDLESNAPPLNPYFLLEGNNCQGIWSDQILDILARVRPRASFAEKNECLSDIGYDKEGRLITGPNAFFRGQRMSLKVSCYNDLHPSPITIN